MNCTDIHGHDIYFRTLGFLRDLLHNFTYILNNSTISPISLMWVNKLTSCYETGYSSKFAKLPGGFVLLGKVRLATNIDRSLLHTL